MFNKKKYYKIVRSISCSNGRTSHEIRHSCYIPIYNEFSIIYRIGKWTTGIDLFIFECPNPYINFLKELVNQICISKSVIDKPDDDYDNLEYVKCELWECQIGEPIPINAGYMKPLHLFLEEPDKGIQELQKAKEATIPVTNPKQLVTNKVKLTSLVYTHTEDKILFHEGMKQCT